MILLYCMGFCFAIAKQDYKKVVRLSIYFCFVCNYLYLHVIMIFVVMVLVLLCRDIYLQLKNNYC